MAIKRDKDKRRIILSSKKMKNYKSNIKDDINPDQAYDKYLL